MKQAEHRFSSLAFVIGMAGLPVYIHAPKYFVDVYGISLVTMGVIIFFLRLVDVFQDPILGIIASKTTHFGALPIALSVVAMCVGMIMLFAIHSPISPSLWFAISLFLVFSGFSFAYIRSYAQGLINLGAKDQIRLARWREVGTTLGICVAAILPTSLLLVSADGYPLFAIFFCLIAILALIHVWSQFSASNSFQDSQNSFSSLLSATRNLRIRNLLFLALVNSSPVALSSTLFLFFVESRLNAPDWAGIFLILFFLAAAIATPFWTKLADVHGVFKILKISMLLSIISFFGATFLAEGDGLIFSAICLLSGATVGADLALLPVLFARQIENNSIVPDLGFSLWNFVSKATLAFAAVISLPLLELVGFNSSGPNSENALLALTFGYAVLPCILKCISIFLLFKIMRDEAQISHA
jgi:GPH family glycoside/pentoside/hexuronide:cation symporter